jgi:ribosomal protein S27AE
MLPAGRAIVRAAAARRQDRRCPVCGREVKPPALHFDRVECVREYVARAREREQVLTPRGKA